MAKSKLAENERRVKENLTYKSGLRGNEAEPTRFLSAPNESQELPLEKPVYDPGQDSPNPEYSLPGVQVRGGAKDEEEAMGRSAEARAKGRKGNLNTNRELGRPTETSSTIADDGDEEEDDDRPVYGSGMRGAERRRRK